MAKLTKAYIDKIDPPGMVPNKKGELVPTYKIHWDEAVRGFGLRITSAGTMSYIAQSRIGGKAVRLTIGSHGRWTPDLARDEAKELLRSMDKGIDPRQVKLENAAVSVTLRKVADTYMRERHLKDSTKREIERHVTTSLALWLNKPIASITRADVSKRFGELRDHGLRGKRGAPAQANQSFSVLRSLINFARWQYRKADDSPVIVENACDVLTNRWNPVRPRTSRIPDNKFGEVYWLLLNERETARTRNTLSSVELTMFLLLTGARSGEGAGLTWDRIDLDEGWFHLPDPKNHNEVWLPLSSVAVEMLTTCKHVPGNPFVFPSSFSKSGHINNPHGIMRKVSAIAGKHLSPHDLRRSFSNLGIAILKIDLYKVELLTNHVPKSVTMKHYLDTSDLRYLQPETQKISDWIIDEAAVAEAKATGTNVVPLHG